MAYATQMQIQIAAGGSAKLIELTDQENNVAIDATVLAEIQSKAEGWINGFLRLRYAIPVSPLTTEGTATLARLSADETVFQLRFARHFVDQFDIDTRKNREVELEELRDGKRRLDEPLPNKSSAVISQFVENCSDFSRDKLGDIF